MGVDVKLAALNHEPVGHVDDRPAIQIEPFMKAAANIIDADCAPKRERYSLHPRQDGYQCLRYLGKFRHGARSFCRNCRDILPFSSFQPHPPGTGQLMPEPARPHTGAYHTSTLQFLEPPREGCWI